MLIPLSLLCKGFLYFSYMYIFISCYIILYQVIYSITLFFQYIYIYILIVFMPLLQSISKFVFIIVNFDVLELFLYFIYVYSCHVMSHRVTSCHTRARVCVDVRACAHVHRCERVACALSCHIMSYHVISCHIMSSHVIS